MCGICFLTMPGPLSSMMSLHSPSSWFLISTWISGGMPTSSQASSALSTPSLTLVMSALVELPNPRMCLFRSKNSATEISFCFFARSSAVICGKINHPFYVMKMHPVLVI